MVRNLRERGIDVSWTKEIADSHGAISRGGSAKLAIQLAFQVVNEAEKNISTERGGHI